MWLSKGSIILHQLLGDEIQKRFVMVKSLADVLKTYLFSSSPFEDMLKTCLRCLDQDELLQKYFSQLQVFETSREVFIMNCSRQITTKIFVLVIRKQSFNLFLGKGVLKICSKFTGEQKICFATLLNRHGCSPVNLLHIFRTPFSKNTSGGLLLVIHIKDVFKMHCKDEHLPKDSSCCYVFQTSSGLLKNLPKKDSFW